MSRIILVAHSRRRQDPLSQPLYVSWTTVIDTPVRQNCPDLVLSIEEYVYVDMNDCYLLAEIYTSRVPAECDRRLAPEYLVPAQPTERIQTDQ